MQVLSIVSIRRILHLRCGLHKLYAVRMQSVFDTPDDNTTCLLVVVVRVSYSNCSFRSLLSLSNVGFYSFSSSISMSHPGMHTSSALYNFPKWYCLTSCQPDDDDGTARDPAELVVCCCSVWNMEICWNVNGNNNNNNNNTPTSSDLWAVILDIP